MRGVISLALALPLTLRERGLLIFLTFCVILVTLAGQGLTLPWIIRLSGVRKGDGTHKNQVVRARAIAVQEAMAHIVQLADECPKYRLFINTFRKQCAHYASYLGEYALRGGGEGALNGSDAISLS